MEKRKIGTIDLTPTWESLLPILLMLHTEGDAKGRQTAIEELTRMAQIADLYVAASKRDQG